MSSGAVAAVMTRPRTLRVRLALVFGVTATIVAAGLGALLLHQARRQLAIAVNEGLVPIGTELADEIATEGPGVVAGGAPELRPPSDALAQVLDARGRILATSPFPANDRPLLSPAAAARVVARDARMRGRASIGDTNSGTVPVRLMARRVVAAGNRPVVLVAATRFDEARRLENELEGALSVGLPVLALAVAFGGWLLTGAMFKPVRSMIEQADTISATEAGERLRISGGGAELRALAARLNAMLDRIEEAAAHERAFLDDASHELRTPISIVRGELEMARSKVVGDAELAGALDSVLDEVERLERLAHNLVVLARSRSGTLTAGETPVDLETVVSRAVRAVSRRATNRQVQIRSVGNAVVDGDESSLERAVLNLLDNAVRYAGSTVTVTISEGRSVVDLAVTDDGPGFDEDLLPHAFNRFTRDPARHGGMGLGLAITAAIAAAHGGHVSATNPEGGGAEVRLRLPAA